MEPASTAACALATMSIADHIGLGAHGQAHRLPPGAAVPISPPIQSRLDLSQGSVVVTQ